MKKIFYYLFVFIILAPSAWSGGPLRVFMGRVLLWERSRVPITYIVDQGRLGPLNHYQAVQLIEDAFDFWSDVPTSWLEYQMNRDEISTDVVASNYETVTAQIADDLIPIIFDDDGEIIDLLMGNNAKESVLGLAYPRTNGRNIVGGLMVFNGYFFERNNYSRDEMLATVIHEIGHVCGLDHSQLFRHLAYNGIGEDDRSVPIMFPTTTDEEKYRLSLTPDDYYALSNLYPKSGYLTTVGKIEGEVKQGSTTKPGVNVVAIDVNKPDENVFSTTTGQYNSTGQYSFDGLPPGTYQLMVEAIDPAFFGASSVGQHTDSSTDLAFQNPIQPEYFNVGDVVTEPLSLTSTVHVSTGDTTTNINFNTKAEALDSTLYTVFPLALNTKVYGGIRAGYYNYYDFWFEPSSQVEGVELVFEFDQTTTYAIEIKREVGNRTLKETYQGNGTQHRILLADENIGGDVPLEETQYIISVANTGNNDIFFTMVANELDQIEPTPTVTPTTPPDEATPTPTPNETFTPGPSPTPDLAEPTATPTPSPTPTSSTLAGDVNRDGVINGIDLFYFSQDWYLKSFGTGDDSRKYNSELWNRIPLQIDLYDLIILKEKIQNKDELNP